MRIDLLLKARCGFSYETYTAQRVVETLEKRRIPYKKIYLSDGILQDYIHYLAEKPPVHMVSFVPLLPYEVPFCDFVKVPQCIWVRGSLGEAANFLTSKFGTVAIPRPSTLPKTFFLPHGVEATPPQERCFDVVFFSPLVDLECLKQRWEEFFSPDVIARIETVIKEGSSPYEVFSSCHSIEAVEEYVRAEQAQCVITSATYRLDVFGEHIGSNWYRRLPNASHIHLHALLPYASHFDVLAQSKVVILDPLDQSWQLPAAAAGCVPLMADREDLQDQISSYLADSQKRKKAIESYQEQITKQSWENQTTRLIEHVYES